MGKTFYITTAIDYVNGKPHLGHAYEKVLTDAIARFQRYMGRETFFLTGNDEHGQKVQQSAERQGRSAQEFCDEMSGYFQDMCAKLNTSNDDFVRTTQDRHKKVVREILQKIYDAGDIYEADYQGYYSPRQEQFLTEKEMVDGKFPEHYGEVIELKEKNYFFRLGKYQDWLKEHIAQNPDWIYPSFRIKEVLGALENPIPDLCISRPKDRLNWGIPLPFDDTQVTYVWFDALINYVSVIGWGTPEFQDKWPGIHVIGKDIMVPPHAIYWPIMLKAAGLEPPKQLLVHGFWTQNKEKMSKSTGNVVDPLALMDIYGVDAFRFFVLREMAVGQDADFTEEQFRQRYQSDLGNEVGNLLNRTVSMIKRYRGGVIPKRDEQARNEEHDADLETKVIQAGLKFREHMENYACHLALGELWRGFQRMNQYVEESAPWKLAKDEAQAARLDYVLAQLAAGVSLLLRELTPILPATVEKALTQLGLEPVKLAADPLTWPSGLAGVQVNNPEPLFPRIEDAA